MLININRKKIYKSAMKNNEEKLMKKIIKQINKEEELEEYFEKYQEYSIKHNYRTQGGTFRSSDKEDNYFEIGFLTKEQFVRELAKMVKKMILIDINQCKEHGILNEDKMLYVPLDKIDEMPSNDYGYLGSGRLLIQGFDWSYDDSNNYDYSFVVYMSI